MSNKKFKHYWICDDCAKKMGGTFPKGHICTVTSGTCKYCNTENVTLTPYVDFNWNDEKLTKFCKQHRD